MLTQKKKRKKKKKIVTVSLCWMITELKIAIFKVKKIKYLREIKHSIYTNNYSVILMRLKLRLKWNLSLNSILFRKLKHQAKV